MDDCVIDAIIDGRIILTDNGLYLTPEEAFLGYQPEVELEGDKYES